MSLESRVFVFDRSTLLRHCSMQTLVDAARTLGLISVQLTSSAMIGIEEQSVLGFVSPCVKISISLVILIYEHQALLIRLLLEVFVGPVIAIMQHFLTLRLQLLERRIVLARVKREIRTQTQICRTKEHL